MIEVLNNQFSHDDLMAIIVILGFHQGTGYPVYTPYGVSSAT